MPAPWRHSAPWLLGWAALLFAGSLVIVRIDIAQRRSIAHELNQPLTAVLSSTQAAVRLLADEPPALSTAQHAMLQAAAQPAGADGQRAAPSARTARTRTAPPRHRHCAARPGERGAGRRGGAGADPAQPGGQRDAGAAGAFKAGAAEFLEKPVDDEALLEALHLVVRAHVQSRKRVGADRDARERFARLTAKLQVESLAQLIRRFALLVEDSPAA